MLMLFVLVTVWGVSISQNANDKMGTREMKLVFPELGLTLKGRIQFISHNQILSNKEDNIEIRKVAFDKNTGVA